MSRDDEKEQKGINMEKTLRSWRKPKHCQSMLWNKGFKLIQTELREVRIESAIAQDSHVGPKEQAVPRE